MINTYLSGDVYLGLAKMVGAVPADATAFPDKALRQRFKSVGLAINYAMGPDTLAGRIQQPPIYARDLLRTLREAYPDFWRWSDNIVDRAMLTGMLNTVFGWQLRTSQDPNPRTFRNFPMQSTGAELMRLAACMATERGIEVCAPIHDAFLICAPLDRLDADVVRMQNIMAEASRIVLGGFELRTDADTIRYPDRYMDERGSVMWAKVMALLDKFSKPATSTPRRLEYRVSDLPTGLGNQWIGVGLMTEGRSRRYSMKVG